MQEEHILDQINHPCGVGVTYVVSTHPLLHTKMYVALLVIGFHLVGNELGL